MKYYIDIEDGSGAKVGAGPITTATEWRQTRRMDKAGEFAFTMPAGDSMAQHLQARRVARCYTAIDGTVAEIGAGIIDEIAVDATAQPIMLTISGGDLVRELASRSVGFLELNNVTFASAVSSIMAFAPSGWSATATATDTIYAKFAGESVLAALRKICEQVSGGMHFYLSGSRALTFTASNAASGVRAVKQTTATAGAEICLITSLAQTSESHDLVTRIYPYGAGNGKNRLTLEYTTKTAPTGYTLDTTNNYLKKDGAETTYGRIEKYLSYKNIAPISNSLANLQNAADALFVEVYNQLRLQSAPYKQYRLAVAGLDTILYPTQTLRVVWDEFVDGYHAVAIDTDLIILEAETTIDGTGARVTGLTVATVDTYPRDDYAAIVEQMNEGRVVEAHPQLTATKDRVGPYTLRIDSTHNAKFGFNIGNETTALNYAILRFKTSPLRASVKSVTASGGGAVVELPVSGGTSHSHNFVMHKSLSTYKTVYYSESTKEFSILGTGANDLAASLDAETSHTHTMNIPEHTHPTSTVYGIYQDTQYPSGITIWIDGVDRTLSITGSTTIAGGSAIELTYDVTQYLDDQSTLRSTHSIEFRCTGGQGEIEAELAMLMTVQAIAVV